MPAVLVRQDANGLQHRCPHEEINNLFSALRRLLYRSRRRTASAVAVVAVDAAAADSAVELAGGGYSGGARPSLNPAFNRSPSMSRAAPSQAMNRPSQQPPSRSQGKGIRAIGPAQLPSANRPAQLPATRPGAAGTRPAGRDLPSGLSSASGPARANSTTSSTCRPTPRVERRRPRASSKGWQ